MNNYECMVLLDNREVKKGWQTTKQNVVAVFEKHGAEVVSARLWDERRLAYPIKRQERATYLLLYFKGSGDVANAVRRDFELTEYVLRQLFLVVDEIPEEAHEPEAEFDESKLQTTDTADQPESIREAAAEEKAEAERADAAEQVAADKAAADKAAAEKAAAEKTAADQAAADRAAADEAAAGRAGAGAAAADPSAADEPTAGATAGERNDETNLDEEKS